MPISFPSSPSSGQRYEFSFNAWTYNGTFWQSTGSSGQITSGAIGDNVIFSGNIASGSISAFNLASGVGGSSLVLTSGSITSGFIGNDAATSGNIASGQVGRVQINDYNVGVLNNNAIGGSKGFFAGGFNGANLATADKVTYSTDTTTAQTTANLSQARSSLAGCSGEGTKGYFADASITDVLVYFSEKTNAIASANLSSARSNFCGITQGSSKGYFAGGQIAAYLTTTDKLTYSNNTTAAQTTADLSQGRNFLAGCSGERNKGYFTGGQTSATTFVSTTDKITYSNDTTVAQTTANLTTSTRALSSVSNNVNKGYFSGGDTGTGGSPVKTVFTYLLTYSTDTIASQTTANLSQARNTMGGISDGLSKGYFAGGNTTAGGAYVATADKLTYSNDTTTAQTTANLSQARSSLAGVGQENTTVFGDNCVFSGNISSSEIGSIHFGFSYPTSGSIKSGNIGDNAVNSGNIGSGQVGRFQISYFNPGTNLNLIIGGGQGYFAGGLTTLVVTTANKLTYSTDTTIAQTSANLSQARWGLAGCSGDSKKGYFAGGLDIGANSLSTTDKLIYATNTTAAQTSANLSQARYSVAGCSDGTTKGYFAGGYSNNYSTTADKLIYATDTTTAQTSANLSQARYYVAGCSGDSTKGYFAGGYTDVAPGFATADKLTYSNDVTIAQATANLSQARYGVAGCSGDSTKGYFAGGFTDVAVATADKLTYSTDTTAAQTSSNLSQARGYSAGVSERITKGYFAGGFDGDRVATADKLTYSTDVTITQTSANLSQARYNLAGVGEEFTSVFNNNSITSGNIASGQIGQFHFLSGVIQTATNTVTLFGGTKGFFAGGSAGNYVATADKVTYSTDTTIAQTTANLSQARSDLAGISQGTTKGYFVGGITDVHVRTGDMIIYSTETTAVQTSAQLPSPGRSQLAGCDGEGTKGYFAGGSTGATTFVNAYKTTYSTDTTAAQVSANLSQARFYLAGISDWIAKGYFIGGLDNTGSFYRATADKIIYSTDTTAAQTSANLPTATYLIMSVCQGSEKSYILGGNTSAAVRVTTANILTYATDTTATQTSANLSTATTAGAGVSEGSSKGYVAGGNTANSALVATAYKITFATDTTDLQASANLSQARNYLAGVGQYSFVNTTVNSGSFGNSSVNSGNIASGIISRFHLSDSSVYSDAVRSGSVSTFKLANNVVWSGNISISALTQGGINGYFAGGNNGSQVATADKLTYATDTTIAQTSANLSQGRDQVAGCSGDSTKGYFAGGSTGAIVATADKLIYSTDSTAAQASANLSQARGYLAGVSEGSTKGYFAGGYAGVNPGVATADKLTYSTDATAAQTTANISQARYYLAGVNGTSTKGYFAGGNSGSRLATADKLTYSTDTTVAQTTADLSTTRDVLAGCSGDSTKGYFAGGGTGFNPGVVTADKLTYSTDTTTAQTTANLSQARYWLAGSSDGTTKGYFAGGYQGTPPGVATADKVTYSTDTTAAQTTANISQARYQLAGVAGQGVFTSYNGIQTVNLASGGVRSGAFGDNAISSGDILSGRITSINISSGAFQSFNIASGSVNAAQLASGAAVGAFKLASGIVVSGNIASGSIFFTPFIDGAIESGNIASGAIGNIHLGNESVTSGAVPSGTVIFNMVGANATVAYNFADVALASGNFALQSVTAENLADGVWPIPTASFVSGGITAFMFDNNSIVSGSLASGLVTSGSLTTTAANEIRFTNMASGSVVSGNIVSGVVFSDATTNNFSNAGVRSGNIASGQVGRVHFANETILSGNIGSGVIRFPEFFGDATTYTNIASGQIDQYHLNWNYNGSTIKVGFFAGGYGNTTYAATNKLTYSTDITVAQTSANLSQARNSLTGISEGTTKGYFAGGSSSFPVGLATADKLTYSNNTTTAQTSANLSQSRFWLAGVSGQGTKGYFAGGAINNSGGQVTTAEKLTYSTDTTTAQTSANLSQSRFYLAGVSEGSTKGYFAGGNNGNNVTTADKLTYSNDTTVAQTTANLSTLSGGLVAGVSGEGTKGYFAGNDYTTAEKLTYSTDTTATQTTANLSQARSYLAGVSEGSTKGYFAGGSTGGGINVSTTDKINYSTDIVIAQGSANLSEAQYGPAGVDGGFVPDTSPTAIVSEAYLTSSKLSSGTIGLTTASGQNAAFPYNLSETAEINTNRPMFDYFVFQEQCSGIKAVCIASGSRVVRAQRASGMRLPAIGVTSGTVNSGTIGAVYYYGYVGRTGTFAQNSGLNNGISGFQGRPLYVGSGGNIVNQSGFWVGGVQQPPFISGDMQQQIGIAMSGGLFVMPSPRVVRSGFRGTLPYNHPA